MSVRSTLVSFLLVSGAAAPLHADGVVRDSLGATSSGRGGAILGYADTLSLIHDNPAALVHIETFEGNRRIELVGDLLFTHIEYEDPGTSDTARGTFVLPQIAFAARLGDDFTAGIGLFLPGGYGADYELDHPIYGEQDYRSRGTLLKLLPALSFRIDERWSVGAGAGLGWSETAFELPYTFQTGALAGQTGLVDSEASGFAATGNLGVQYRPRPGLTIGLAWISETAMRQEGDFDLDVTGGPLSGLVTDPDASYDLEYDFRWPQSVGLGVRSEHSFGAIGLDVLWYDWSRAFDEIEIELSDGDNPEFDALAGPSPTDVFPLDWDDSVSVRLGFETPLGERTVLRLGYVYNTNPIPDRTLTPILPAILEHTVSTGLGHRTGPWSFDLAYQYSTGRKQEVGTSDIVGGDFDQSELSVHVHWVFASVSLDF